MNRFHIRVHGDWICIQRRLLSRRRALTSIKLSVCEVPSYNQMSQIEHQRALTVPVGNLGQEIRALRFVLVFCIVFFGLQVIYYWIPDRFLDTVVINKGIVRISANILTILFGLTDIDAVGTDLVSRTTRLSVVRGCDGTAVLFVLVAAIFAVRTTAVRLFLGVILATALVYALNQIRIVSMFLLLQIDPGWFHLAHVYVAPAAMVLISVGAFAIWARTVLRT